MTNKEEKIIIYTDGSCLGNPGPSGWCFCLFENNKQWVVSGSEISSTNNRMELTAIIEALKFTENTNCVIYTDSQLCLNCATNKWRRKSNLDLWDLYNNASENKKIKWVWVKAHNGNKYNELVDKIARKEATSVKK
jgi:ribonuclease HI